MNKNNLDNLEFLTSIITTVLLLVITYLQYQKDRPFWWIILLVSIFMGANAYMKYKKIEIKNWNHEDFSFFYCIATGYIDINFINKYIYEIKFIINQYFGEDIKNELYRDEKLL